jgi:hypothetical protein
MKLVLFTFFVWGSLGPGGVLFHERLPVLDDCTEPDPLEDDDEGLFLSGHLGAQCPSFPQMLQGEFFGVFLPSFLLDNDA